MKPVEIAREKIAENLYEQARQSANLLYEMLHRFDPAPDERYELWTKEWGDWASANDIIKKIYLILADQILDIPIPYKVCPECKGEGYTQLYLGRQWGNRCRACSGTGQEIKSIREILGEWE